MNGSRIVALAIVLSVPAVFSSQLAGCGGSSDQAALTLLEGDDSDAGIDSAQAETGQRDAGQDALVVSDTGSGNDAAVQAPDAVASVDAVICAPDPPPDAGAPETSGPRPETGIPDAATPGPDATTPDTGTLEPDAGSTAEPDAATPETATPLPDAETPETGTPDANGAGEATTDTGTGGGEPCDISTVACLQSRDRSTDPDSIRCSQCAADNGCLDPASQGGTCEMTAGTAPDSCAAVLGTSAAPTETQLCLRAMKDIFSSQCAATLQETPCLCGNTDAAQCLAGTAPATGPLLPIYTCDLGANVATILANFTVPTFGAGRANAILGCLGAFGCNCF
jgi:hypothetical protein